MDGSWYTKGAVHNQRNRMALIDNLLWETGGGLHFNIEHQSLLGAASQPAHAQRVGAPIITQNQPLEIGSVNYGCQSKTLLFTHHIQPMSFNWIQNSVCNCQRISLFSGWLQQGIHRL